MHGQKHLTALKHSIQVPRDRLSRHLRTLVKRLTIGRMGVSLSQVVAIAVLVEWVLQRVAMGWKFGACSLIAVINDSPNGCQFYTVRHLTRVLWVQFTCVMSQQTTLLRNHSYHRKRQEERQSHIHTMFLIHICNREYF